MVYLKIPLIFIINFIFSPVYFLCYLLCFVLSFLPIFPSLTAKENLKKRLFIQGMKLHFYIAHIYLNYFFYAVEAFIFKPFYLNASIAVKNCNLVKIFQAMKEAYPQSKELGFVFLLSHMGNVELYTPPVTRAFQILKQEKAYALAKPSKIKVLNMFLLWYREKTGLGVLWNDKHLLINMSKAIKKGGSIAMLVDQKPKMGGTFIRFFNEYAAFPISGLRLCLNQKMMVVYASGRRLMPGFMQLKIICGQNIHLRPHASQSPPPALLPAEIYKPEMTPLKDQLAAQEMSYFAKWIEDEIRKNPTQWSWDYRKWSRKPS